MDVAAQPLQQGLNDLGRGLTSKTNMQQWCMIMDLS